MSTRLFRNNPPDMLLVEFGNSTIFTCFKCFIFFFFLRIRPLTDFKLLYPADLRSEREEFVIFQIARRFVKPINLFLDKGQIFVNMRDSSASFSTAGIQFESSRISSVFGSCVLTDTCPGSHRLHHTIGKQFPYLPSGVHNTPRCKHCNLVVC